MGCYLGTYHSIGSCFFVHGVILAYIIAWIIIPMAHTAPEKLAMKGAAINVENIGKTVTDGFEKVNDYVAQIVLEVSCKR